MGVKCERHFCSEKEPKALQPDWMSQIPNHIPLSLITIPGTHNSCALHGGAIAITQTWSIENQLQAGIRYFDLRLRLYKDTLRFYHGIIDQQLTFDEVLSVFASFLNEHNRETIIMAIQHEYKQYKSTKSMAQLYDEYTQPYRDIIIKYNGRDMLMETLRGKILFVEAFYILAKRISNFNMQNEWVVNYPSDIKEKKRKIKRHLNKAIFEANNNSSEIYVNYLSGSSDYILVTPGQNAYQTNKVVFKFEGRLGIILSDFPGEGLIEHLISQNHFNENEPPMTNTISSVIEHRMYVNVVNITTNKYLSCNNEGELVCTKNEVLFKLEKCKEVDTEEQNEIRSRDKIKLINQHNRKEFTFCILSYAEMRRKMILEYQKRTAKTEEQKQHFQNELDKNVGDLIRDKKNIYLLPINEEIQDNPTTYICSDYQYNDPELKIQKVVTSHERYTEGTQWMLIIP